MILIEDSLQPLTGALAPLTDALAPVSDGLAPITDVLKPVTGAIAPVTDALAPVSGALAPVSDALGSVASALDPVAGALGPVTGALSPVTGALGPVTGALGPVTGALGTVTGALGPISGALGPISGALGPVTGALAPVTGALGPVTDALKPVTDALKPVTGALAPVTNPLTPITGASGLGFLGIDLTGQGQPNIAASASATPQTGGENSSPADNGFLGSTLPLPFNQDGLNDLPGFNESPLGAANSPFSYSLPNPFGQVGSELPGILPPSAGNGYEGLLRNLPGYVSTPSLRGDMSPVGSIARPYSPHPDNVPQAAKAIASPAHWKVIGETVDGRLIEESNGVMRLLPISDPLEGISAESVPAPPSSPAPSVSSSMILPALSTVLSGSSSSTLHALTPSSLPAHSLMAVVSSAAELSMTSSATLSIHSSTLPTPATLSTAGISATSIPLSAISPSPSSAPRPPRPSVQQAGQVIDFAPDEVMMAHPSVVSSSDLLGSTSLVNATPSPAIVTSTLTSAATSIETSMHSLPTPATLSAPVSSNISMA